MLSSGPKDPHRSMAITLTTGPQRWFSLEQLPVKRAACFALTKSTTPGAKTAPVATQDHPQAPLQHHAEEGSSPASCRLCLHHPRQPGDTLGPACRPFLVLSRPGGTHENPALLLSQYLQARDSQQSLLPSELKQLLTLPKSSSHPSHCLAGGEAF